MRTALSDWSETALISLRSNWRSLLFQVSIQFQKDRNKLTWLQTEVCQNDNQNGDFIHPSLTYFKVFVGTLYDVLVFMLLQSFVKINYCFFVHCRPIWNSRLSYDVCYCGSFLRNQIIQSNLCQFVYFCLLFKTWYMQFSDILLLENFFFLFLI